MFEEDEEERAEGKVSASIERAVIFMLSVFTEDDREVPARKARRPATASSGSRQAQ